MDSDEIAGLDAILELADRSAHQMRSPMRVDRDIIVLATDAVDRIESHSHQSGRPAQPELRLERFRPFAARERAEIADDLLHFAEALLGVVRAKFAACLAQ